MRESRKRAAALDRKARSIARLTREGIPTMANLPWQPRDPANVQPPEAIARRASVLALLAVYAEPDGMSRPTLDKQLCDRALLPDLTPKERAFLDSPAPTDADRGPFTWHYESVHVLLWALGYVKSLAMPTTYANAREITAIVGPRTPERLLRDARPRNGRRICDEADLALRYHWAARHAALHNTPLPAALLPGVCLYRQRTFQWLLDKTASWDTTDASS
jgi:hypothetical protein